MALKAFGFIKNDSCSGNHTSRAVIFLYLCLTMTGCLTLEEIAPSIGMMQTTAGISGDSAELELGRSLYLGTCIKCHVAEPIDGYTKAEWLVINADMAPESNLTDAELGALNLYVFVAHDYLTAKKKLGAEGEMLVR